MELRGERRYGLNAPAAFMWEAGGCGRVRGAGITRDLSIVAAFVMAADCPPVKSTVQIEIALPSLPGVKAAICLMGTAQVIRVECRETGRGEVGFAVLKDGLDQWTLSDDLNRTVPSGSRAAVTAETTVQGRGTREF
jgi:hypothetical protein